MVKTTRLNEDTHKCLKKIQMVLYEKYDIEMNIPDIIGDIFKNYERVIGVILENQGISNLQIVEKEDMASGQRR